MNKQKEKNTNQSKKFNISKKAFSIIILLLSILLFTFYLLLTAQFRNYVPGATAPVYKHYNVMNVKDKLPHKKYVSTDINKLSSGENSLFILYQEGCKYCDAAHLYLMKKFESYNEDKSKSDKMKENVRFVEVASDLGNEIVKDEGLEEPFNIVVKSSDGKSYIYKEVLEGKKTKTGRDTYKYEADTELIDKAFKKYDELNKPK